MLTLAHELGHAMLLGHGNGLDDNHDGLLPPTTGIRRFDGTAIRCWLLAPDNTLVAEDRRLLSLIARRRAA